MIGWGEFCVYPPEITLIAFAPYSEAYFEIIYVAQEIPVSDPFSRTWNTLAL